MFACEAFTIFALLRSHRTVQCFDKASTRLLQGAHNVFAMCFTMLLQVRDSLPEWSRVVDSSSTSASCVGSNPTAVMLLKGFQKVFTSLCFFFFYQALRRLLEIFWRALRSFLVSSQACFTRASRGF